MEQPKKNVALAVPAPTAGALAELPKAAREAVAAALASSRAEATKRAYGVHLRDFTAWCARKGLVAFPAKPATVAAYAAESAQSKKLATVKSRLTAISAAHKLKGLPSPCADPLVKNVVEGLKRLKGVKHVKRKAATLDVLQRLLATVPPTCLANVRDRAVLLLGYATAFRRSELAALRVDDLLWTPQGLTVHLRKSKTDQTGHGRDAFVVPSPHPDTCAIAAVKAWLQLSGVREGPLFRAVRGTTVSAHQMHPDSIADIVQAAARAAGYNPAVFGGHSLRRGFVTETNRQGASESLISQQTGHTSERSVHGYIEGATMPQHTAATFAWKGLGKPPKAG